VLVDELTTSRISRRAVMQAGAAGAALATTPFLFTGQANAQDIPTVDRNRTLILRWGGVEGRHVDAELWNGYAIGANHQNGLVLMYEPLAFYSAFADETIPWLAESWEFSDDLLELRIKLREGITWSDGEAFDAEDVAFTLNSLVELGPQVRWGVDVEQFVESAEAVGEYEAVVTFKVPSPRFFYFMTYKYDIGLYIVPQHVYEGQDWTSFTAFDVEQGWPVTTGPWRVVFSSPDQKVLDRAESWWAVEQGLVEAMPAVERVIYLPFTQETQVAQQVISNQIDASLDLRPLTMETILAQNPAVITHTLTESPFGYVDWWPTSLYVNNEIEPFSDPNVRWALSYFINREQIIDVALAGAGSSAPLPMPTYPGLIPFFEEVADLI